MLEGEPFPRPPEAGLDLVEDQQDAMLIRDLAQAFHERGGRRDITALPHHGLDQNGCCFFRRGLRSQQIFKLFERVLTGLLIRHTKPVSIRKWRDKDTRWQRSKTCAVNRLGSG